MSILYKILVASGSLTTVAFGLWHFFVPRAWKWWSYIDPKATELVAAVRAINVFFSLSLVLFGLLNLVLVFSGRANRFSILVVLAATCLLWVTRVVMQIAFPQGSINPALQYGMLTVFVLVTLCFLVSLGLVLFQKPVY